MEAAVLKHLPEATSVIMAAAVADFRPKNQARDKIKKEGGIPRIELEATEDILQTVSVQRSEKKRPFVMVGFAAESRDLLENASSKLTSKGLDMIAANDISASDAGFAVETNRVTLLYADGRELQAMTPGGFPATYPSAGARRPDKTDHGKTVPGQEGRRRRCTTSGTHAKSLR